MTPMTIDDLLAEAAQAYANPIRPTLAACIRTVRAIVHWENMERTVAGLPPLQCPTRNQVARAIDRLGAFEVYAARYGRAAARRRFAATVGRS